MSSDQSEFWDGEERKRQGMERALGNSPEESKVKVIHATEELAESGRRFTAEDARLLSGDPPLSPGAWGALFRQMAVDGMIEHVGYTKSLRPRSNAAIIKVYVGTRISQTV